MNASAYGRGLLPWLLVFMLGGFPSAAQTPAEGEAEADVVPPRFNLPSSVVRMDSIGELSRSDELEGELRGARETDPEDWPASFYSRFDAGSPCTSALVGERVLLTAAHCVSDGGTIHFKSRDVPYRGTCSHAPEYAAVPAVSSADYALCLVNKPVPVIRFENVNIDPAVLQGATELLLTGFGCTTDQGTGGHDNKYRIGEADIVIRDFPITSSSRNYIKTHGRAALCFGDSGGPAFLIRPGRVRLLVSVNSIVGNGGSTSQLTRDSYLSSTSKPDAKNFFTLWKNELASRTPAIIVKICGIDGDAQRCRT